MPDTLLKGPKTLILVLLISFASVSGVLFTPSLPDLADSFGVPDSIAQLAMTVFLIGYSLGQLPYGPIANRFGRKKAIYIGVTLAITGALICLLSKSIELFCLGRFIQALGSAAGLKIAFTMIGDSNKGAAATKVLSYVMLAFAVVPGIGVALGGFITVSYGWSGCFVFLLGYSVLVALLCSLLPETAPKLDLDALKGSKIAKSMGAQFKDPFLVWHALLMGLGTSLIYLFATVAPYIGIEQMGLTPDQYGLWNLVPSIGMIVGLFTSAHFSTRLPPRIAMLSGIILALIGAFLMGAFFSNGYVNPLTFFVPAMLLLVGDSIFFSAASGKALSEAKDKSNASAVMQFINMGVATTAVICAGISLPLAPLALSAIFGCVAFLALCVWLKLKAHH
jgi:DHA1 family bicyclomycin/chloramphenicol resistance-like MFS transporter